jgi:hypothetical protein
MCMIPTRLQYAAIYRYNLKVLRATTPAADIWRKVSASPVSKFMIYRHTKRHTSVSNNSLLTGVEQKPKYKF